MTMMKSSLFLALTALTGLCSAAPTCTIIQSKCYKDFVSGKRMMVAAGGKLQDRESCIQTCHAKGFALAGLEYGGECYCGAITLLLGDLKPVADKECGMKCPAPSTEKCGGVNRLTLLMFNCNAATKPTPAPTSAPGLCTATSSKCYRDLEGGFGGKRLLPFMNWHMGSLTHQSCMHVCHVKGYSLAGLEFGHQCWCGSPVDLTRDPSIVKEVETAKCSSGCSGNANEQCGGFALLTVLAFTCTAAPPSPAPPLLPSAAICATRISNAACSTPLAGSELWCAWDSAAKVCVPALAGLWYTYLQRAATKPPASCQMPNFSGSVDLDDCLEECSLRDSASKAVDQCYGVHFVEKAEKPCILLNCKTVPSTKIGGSPGHDLYMRRTDDDSKAEREAAKARAAATKYTKSPATTLLACDSLQHAQAESVELCQEQCDERENCKAFVYSKASNMCMLKNCLAGHHTFTHNAQWDTYVKEAAVPPGSSSRPQLPLIKACKNWSCSHVGQMCTSGGGWICSEKPNLRHHCAGGIRKPCWHEIAKTTCTARKRELCEEDAQCQAYGSGGVHWCVATPAACGERKLHNCENRDNCQWSKQRTACEAIPDLCHARSKSRCELDHACAWSKVAGRCASAKSFEFWKTAGHELSGCDELKVSRKQSISLCEHDCAKNAGCYGFQYGTGVSVSNLCVLKSCAFESRLHPNPTFDFYMKASKMAERAVFKQKSADQAALLIKINAEEAQSGIANNDCILTMWGPWQSCSKSCGGGQKSRKRGILRKAAGHGKKCPTSIADGFGGFQQVALCNTDSCSSMRMKNKMQCAKLAPASCNLSPKCQWQSLFKDCVVLPSICEERSRHTCMFDLKCQWQPLPVGKPHCEPVPTDCTHRVAGQCETDGHCKWKMAATKRNRRRLVPSAQRHIDAGYKELCTSKSCLPTASWPKGACRQASRQAVRFPLLPALPNACKLTLSFFSLSHSHSLTQTPLPCAYVAV